MLCRQPVIQLIIIIMLFLWFVSCIMLAISIFSVFRMASHRLRFPAIERTMPILATQGTFMFEFTTRPILAISLIERDA